MLLLGVKVITIFVTMRCSVPKAIHSRYELLTLHC